MKKRKKKKPPGHIFKKRLVDPTSIKTQMMTDWGGSRGVDEAKELRCFLELVLVALSCLMQ